MQPPDDGLWKGNLSILVAFAAAHDNQTSMEVDVPHAKVEKFPEAQSTAILEGEKEVPGRRAVQEKSADLFRGEDHGKSLSMMSATTLLEDELERQHFRDEHGQRVARLRDGCGRQIPAQGEVAQEFLDCLRSRGSVLRNLGGQVRKAEGPFEIAFDRSGTVPLRA